MNRTAVLYALASAALFGASTPAAKALLGSIDPAVLAGLLYCGAGIGIAILRRVASAAFTSDAREQTLGRSDWPWLAGAIAAGGIAGPLLLMAGLSRTDAATASLLLTLEGAATALMAWFIFHENVDRRIAPGMLCLAAGAAVLSWSGSPSWQSIFAPLAIVGACIAWGLDNNLTRKISLADPLQIVMLKGLIAGPFNIALGLWAGGSLPHALPTTAAGIVGFLGYGVSLVFGAPALGHGPHCCIFFDSAVPGCDCFSGRARRTGHRSTVCRWCADGNRRLAASHRASRARAWPRVAHACASACARRTSST
jgi:drug/metabolite transporter (DMT)-like permease